MKKSLNIKIFSLSLVMFGLGALLLFNVLLINVKGIHNHSGVDLNDYNGISFVENEEIPAARGRILDSNGYVLAQDNEAWDIVAYISPDRPGNNLGTYYVDDPEKTADILAEKLGGDREELYNLLTSDNFLTYLGTSGRGLSNEQKEEIEALGLNGIEFERVKKRYYPLTPFASNLVGFASYKYDDNGRGDIVGQTGIETALDDYLKGTPGEQSYYRDTRGNTIVGQQIEYKAAVGGSDVYLTINRGVQTALQKALSDFMSLPTSPTNAWGIVMETKTGKILAYDNYPTYDQNDVNIKDYMDYNAMNAYEPGSTMKSFTFAVAIDSNPDFKLEDTFYSGPFVVGLTDNAEIKRLPNTAGSIGVIYNWDMRSYGTVDYWFAYANSLNTGTVSLLEKYFNRRTLADYLDAFGFFKPVEVLGIPNEAEGVKTMTWPIESVTTTYGQGSSVTALQMVQGYSAFANGGKMVKPYIVDKVVDSHTGSIIYEGQTEIAGQPIKEETAAKILELMKYNGNPANNGTGARFAIDGINVGVKTGTAETVDKYGNYGGATIHSSVVMLPAEDPEIVIYICYKDFDKLYASGYDYWRTLERTVASLCNLYKRPESGSNEPVVVTKRTVFENGMPSLINHSTDYISKQLSKYNLKITKIGSGNTVLKQYPNPGSTIISEQNILLFMGYEGITMPNMTGWTRKEVVSFWEMTGIEITLDGNGYVKTQNIKAGEPIDSNSQIVVTLE